MAAAKTWGRISKVLLLFEHIDSSHHGASVDGGWNGERCAHTNTSLHGNFDDEITAIWQYILAEFGMAKIDTMSTNEYAIHHVHI